LKESHNVYRLKNIVFRSLSFAIFPLSFSQLSDSYALCHQKQNQKQNKQKQPAKNKQKQKQTNTGK